MVNGRATLRNVNGQFQMSFGCHLATTFAPLRPSEFCTASLTEAHSLPSYPETLNNLEAI
jgi:hypothetical protein